jgi:hypothetical protein
MMEMDTSSGRFISPGRSGAGARSVPQPHFTAERKTERQLSLRAAVAAIAGLSLGLWWLLWTAAHALMAGLF